MWEAAQWTGSGAHKPDIKEGVDGDGEHCASRGHACIQTVFRVWVCEFATGMKRLSLAFSVVVGDGTHKFSLS